MKPKQQSSQRKENYRCKWRRCQKTLHNLETLRRHVLEVHRPDIEELSKGGVGYVCWWKRCELLERDDEGNYTPAKAFQSHDEWATHIQDEHIYPIAMKYGDGPTTEPIDLVQIARDRQRYLSDRSGRNTTPNLSEMDMRDLRPDTLNLTEIRLGRARTLTEEADMMARESFFKSHGIGRDLKKQSEEVIRAMAVRKEKIGPGIDRGGCTLINDERRATFVQNPGIRRVVEIDY